MNTLGVNVSVKITAEQIAQLSPEQAKALMSGLAEVLTAQNKGERKDNHENDE